MEKQKAIIKDWCIVRDFLIGTIIEHPIMVAGSIVRTSTIVRDDSKNGIIETRTTIYKLI